MVRACSLTLALTTLVVAASLPANAELLIGISFPSQGGDDDATEIDESLLTLPKLHLQDSSWYGVENRTISSTLYRCETTVKIEFSSNYIEYFTNLESASYSYSSGPAKFNQVRSYFQSLATREQLPSPSVSAKGAPDSSAASDSSISGPGSSSAAQPMTGILSVTLNQDTIQLDWPADYTGWILQTRTNPGINSQWFPVSGSSATNHLDLTLDRANTSVFFRLIAP